MHVARSMHPPLSDKRTKLAPLRAPFGRPVSRTYRISPSPPLEAPLRPPGPAMTPFPPPRILLLLPADACNSPMLNATFASLSTLRSTCLPPSSLFSPPPPPPPTPPTLACATVCVQFMHLVRVYVFIARAHGLYRLVSIIRARGSAAEERVTMRTRRPKIGRAPGTRGPPSEPRARPAGANVSGVPADDGTAL